MFQHLEPDDYARVVASIDGRSNDAIAANQACATLEQYRVLEFYFARARTEQLKRQLASTHAP